ncbi:MAG TPA: hypothetical protein VFH53_04265 [Phycisphaerae bacterium]|nr:hypothetical protein [Phycisphaerae bacterium]
MTPLAVHFAVRPVLPLFWCALVAAVFVALVGLILWRRRSQVSPRRQRILLVLRAAVVVAVLLLLFRPEIRWESRRAVLAQVAFLLDASRSMTIRDAAMPSVVHSALRTPHSALEPLSRASALRRAFLDAAQPCADLAGRAVVRSYAFGARLRPAPNFAPDPVDARTDPGEALARLADRAPPALLAVVLVGDGAANRSARGSPESAAARLLACGTRVHAVAVGSPEPSDRVRDVAVRDLRCPQRVFVGNRPEVRAAVSALGMKGRPVRLVLKADGREIARQDFTPDAPSAAREVVFTPTLAEAGLVRLELEAEPVEGELVAENNSAATLLRVEEGGIRVLYLDGALRPEGKFLARALADADEIDLERRVLVGPGAETAAPQPDDLDRFEVVVLGDLSPAALPAATLARLSERVRAGRLALVALGGSLAFGAGGWDKTPVADLLPFVLRAGDGRIAAPLRFVPTPAGRRHFILPGTAGVPWPDGNLDAQSPTLSAAKGGDSVAGDVFDKLPALSGANIVGPLQPGAVLLAAAPDPGEPALLAVRDTGVFRTAAFTADSTWLWVLSAADPQGPDRHARFWRGLVLWAARRDAAAPGRADLAVLTDRLRYHLADPDRAPAVRATVYARAADDVPRLRLTAPDGRTRDLVLTPIREGEPVRHSPQGEGGWHADLLAAQPGAYCLEAEATVAGKQQTAQTEFVVFEQDLEMTALLADHDALRRTAEAGGGSFRTMDSLGDLFKELAGADMQVFEPVERRWPLASGRVFLALVVALLSADWLLRRRWLLA